MVYGPDGTEYPTWEAAIAAGVTNPSYTKPVATTQAGTQANIPTYGYELARLMAQYGVTSPTPPRTTDQSLINQYFANLNAPMYAAPVGNDLFNRYLDIGMGRLPGGGGPMTSFFPGKAVAPAGYRFDPVTATNVPVTAAGGVAEAGRITTGTPNIGGTQCPPGFNFDPAARNCVPTPSTGLCPVGKVLVNGRCVDAPVSPTPVTPIGRIEDDQAPVTPTPGTNLTDAEAAWVAKSKGFTDDQWREAIAEWVRSNPTATKAQADLRAQQLGVPERLIPYGYEAANYIDNPLASQGLAPATAATQFLTPGVTTGPGGADLYKMFNENIQYAVDPRSLDGAGITENEAKQMWDLAKTLGLSVPQITEKVNVMANQNLSNAEIADVIRRIAPDEAEKYFALTGTNYDPNARRFRGGGLAKLAKKYAAGGDVKQDPMMGLVKKYQQGGLNTTDAYDQLNQARANLRSTIEQLSSQEEVKPPSKAEMYFRLAAAFATPTKTGDFGESLGLAAQQMAEYKGEQRESQKLAQQQRRDLALELAKLDVESAADLVEQQRLASRANSEPGRACQDQGLIPGTADFVACVESARQAEQTRREATEARLQTTADTAASAARREADAAERTATRLPANLVTLKSDTEKELLSAQESLSILASVIKKSPIAYTASLQDKAARAFAEATDADSPKVVATRTMENEISRNLLNSLKVMFGSNPTEGERLTALATAGMEAKSVDERNEILAELQASMQIRQNFLANKLEEINSGRYAMIEEPADGE